MTWEEIMLYLRYMKTDEELQSRQMYEHAQKKMDIERRKKTLDLYLKYHPL